MSKLLFAFGGDNQFKSPDELEAERRRVEQLTGRGGGVPSNVGEGIAALGQAIAGLIAKGQYNKNLKTSNEAGSKLFNSLMGGGATTQPAPTAAAPAPSIAPSQTGTTQPRDAIRSGILASAGALGVDPVKLATAMSYETAGSFDPVQPGPVTKWGRHRGFIQFGEPQAKQYGVDWKNPIESQLGADGAVVKYLKDAGVKPGMGLMDIYSAINAGHVGRYNARDAMNGGAPGTVADKVNNQMGPYQKIAEALMGGGGQNGLGGGAGQDMLAAAAPMGMSFNGAPPMPEQPSPMGMSFNGPPQMPPMPQQAPMGMAFNGAPPQPAPMGMSFNGPPPMPQQAPSQAGPQVLPAPQPLSGSGPPAPMTAFQRMTMNAVDKGSLQEPRPGYTAQQMGLAGPQAAPREGILSGGGPMPTQGSLAGMMSKKQAVGGSPSQGQTVGGMPSREQLFAAMTDPAFRTLEPQQQKMILDLWQQATDPVKVTEYKIKKAELDATLDPLTREKKILELDKLRAEIADAQDQSTNDMIELDRVNKERVAAGKTPLSFETWRATKPASVQTTTNVKMDEESAYAKKRGEQRAIRMGDFEKAAESGRKNLGLLAQMENAVNDPAFYSGNAADAVNAIKKFAVLFGADPNSVSSIEQFNALAKQWALETMGGSLGTGFSNADRDFILQQGPYQYNSKEGNRALIAINRKIENRKIEIARRAWEYEKQHGPIDSQFMAELSDWAEANPLFPPVPLNETAAPPANQGNLGGPSLTGNLGGKVPPSPQGATPGERWGFKNGKPVMLFDANGKPVENP